MNLQASTRTDRLRNANLFLTMLLFCGTVTYPAENIHRASYMPQYTRKGRVRVYKPIKAILGPVFPVRISGLALTSTSRSQPRQMRKFPHESALGAGYNTRSFLMALGKPCITHREHVGLSLPTFSSTYACGQMTSGDSNAAASSVCHSSTQLHTW